MSLMNQEKHLRITARVVALEAIGNQQYCLEIEISRLLDFAKSLPEGMIRAKLIDETSGLDSIAEVIRQALGSIA